MSSSRKIVRTWTSCALTVLVLGFAATPKLSAQKIQFSGYVKTEAVYDTRQVLQIREGHLSLYPLADSPESADDNLLLNAFQSRLTVNGSGTRALGADLSGMLEADFFGVTNDNVNGLRLRHAFVRLNWTRHELMAGQFWSPLFSASVAPGVQAASAGAPFQPFARFTQIRYTWKPGAFNLLAAVSQQRDAFAEIGGSKAQQQAAVPGFHLHGEYRAEAGHIVGVGSYAKSIRPIAGGDRFNAWAVQGYGLAVLPVGSVKAKFTYGTDLADHLMTGGYVETLAGSYEPLQLASGWVDLETRKRKEGPALTAGLFAGLLHNLGAVNDVAYPDLEASGKAPSATLGGVALKTERTRAANAGSIWRLAPRLVFTSGKLGVSAEVEVTSAIYTASANAQLKPQRADSDDAVTNVRTLLSVFYYF